MKHSRHARRDHYFTAEAFDDWLGSEDLRSKLGGVEYASDVDIES